MAERKAKEIGDSREVFFISEDGEMFPQDRNKGIRAGLHNEKNRTEARNLNTYNLDKRTLQNTYHDGMNFLSFVYPIESDHIKGLYAVVEVPRRIAYSTLNGLTTAVTAIIAAAFILLWILGKRFSFGIQRPIRRLADEIESIANGNIGRTLSSKDSVELMKIEKSVNILLDRLKENMKLVLERTGEAVSMKEVMQYAYYQEEPSLGAIISINNFGEITYFNEGAEKLTGLRAVDIVGLDVHNPMPKGIKYLTTEMERCLVSGRLQLKKISDIYNLAQDKIPIEYSINIEFGEKNQVNGVICVFRPISDIQKFQISAQRTKSLGALGEMAANLAHEIKNPLAAIRGYAQIIRGDVITNEQNIEEMDIIIHEVDRLNEMINDFLKFARPEPPKLGRVNLRDVLELAVKIATTDIPSNIIINKNYQYIDTINADSRQIEAVFINIISNGIQAMEKSGGVLSITTKYESIRDMVVIEISDSGCGIPKEQADTIFEPFFTTKENGTGLGLPISSRIVEAHGGIIEVESIEEEMSRFSILLPAR